MASTNINNNLFYTEEEALYFFENGAVIKSEIHHNEDYLSFISDEPKVVIKLDYAYYHFMTDFFCNLLYLHEIHPDCTFVIVGDSFDLPQIESRPHLLFLANFLSKNEINYRFVDTTKNNCIVANKTYFSPTVNMGLVNSYSVNLLRKYFKDYIDDKYASPEKIYVSRLNAENKINKNRILEEKYLEDFFVKNGFTVFNKSFDNYIEQINFFYNAKVIAGVSGAALTNLLIMPSESKVIEITVPIVVQYDFELDEFSKFIESTSHHHFYSHLSFLKKHMYISLPTSNFNATSVKNFLKNKKIFEKI